MKQWMDVSEYDGNVNFATIRHRGIEATTIRASIGGIVDKNLNINIQKAQDEGIVPIFYHFFVPFISPWWTDKKIKKMNGQQQAEFFLSLLPNSSALTMIDVEEKSSYKINLYPGVWIKEVYQFFTVNAFTYLYTNPASLAYAYPSDHWMTFPKLVIAHYSTAYPKVTLPFHPFEWNMWQYTDRADGLWYGSQAKMVSLYVKNPVDERNI